MRSSSRDHSSRLISGLRWLYHRSRHCFPMRPGSCCAILDHCFAPSWPTSSMILSSSSLVHGPLTSSGLRTFCQRWRHWTSVRSSKYSAVGGWRGGAGREGQFEIIQSFSSVCGGVRISSGAVGRGEGAHRSSSSSCPCTAPRRGGGCRPVGVAGKWRRSAIRRGRGGRSVEVKAFFEKVHPVGDFRGAPTSPGDGRCGDAARDLRGFRSRRRCLRYA